MSEEFQIRGVIARITWSYYTCAAIHGYTVTQEKKTGKATLTGTVVSSDAFRLSQQPLVFVAQHARGAWKWQIDTCNVVNGTVHATLSPFKE